GPWRNLTNVSIRQALPEVSGQHLTAQLDIFNFANLLSNKWGHLNAPTLSSTFPQQQVLAANSTGSRLPGPLNQSQSVFTMAPNIMTRGDFRVPDNSFASLYQM